MSHKPPIWHTFRGKRYRIRFASLRNSDGSCDHPACPGKEMVFAWGLHRDGLNELETFIHEPAHASLWDLSEDAVDAFSRDLARWLWRLGYRREG